MLYHPSVRNGPLFAAIVLGGLASIGVPDGARAQEVRTSASSTAPHALREYGGVTPGRPNTPPAMRRVTARRGASARTTILTWPGFQMRPDGGSRFFVQTNAPVATRVATSRGRLEVIFPNTAIHVGNSRRYLETAYFETPVQRAHLERRGRDMVLVMTMRADVTPQISSGAEAGFSFTYIDFAAGHYRPADLGPITPPARSGDGTASVRPASPASAEDYPAEPVAGWDDERPPTVAGPRP